LVIWWNANALRWLGDGRRWPGRRLQSRAMISGWTCDTNRWRGAHRNGPEVLRIDATDQITSRIVPAGS